MIPSSRAFARLNHEEYCRGYFNFWLVKSNQTWSKVHSLKSSLNRGFSIRHSPKRPEVCLKGMNVSGLTGSVLAVPRRYLVAGCTGIWFAQVSGGRGAALHGI